MAMTGPVTLATMMIRPQPVCFMCGTTARQQSHVPCTFTVITC